MKQLTAIFLSVLFLFNLAGYRLMFYFLDNKAGSKYEVLIDNKQYNESELLTIKVDINLPYQVERSDFERVNGEITVDGVVYQYVKRRIYNGQLVLLCIPNEKRTEIRNAADKYAAWTNDVTTDKQTSEDSSKKSQKKGMSDYDCENLSRLANITYTLVTDIILTDEALPLSQSIDSPYHPPKMLSQFSLLS